MHNLSREELQEKYNELQEKYNELERKVGQDPLTGLLTFKSDYGQSAFQGFFDRCVRRVEHGEDISCWLVFVDLVKFKRINDVCGHDVGDKVLKFVADSFSEALRSYDIKAALDPSTEEDMLTRAGGDEFVLALEDISEEDLDTVFSRIVDVYSKLVRNSDLINEDEVCYDLGFNFGAASFGTLTEDQMNLTDWIKIADKYMYQAKDFSHEFEKAVSSYVVNGTGPIKIQNSS